MSAEYNSRKYDIVVFGATGFTGALVCEYIVEINDKTLSWALAGRSINKLEKVKQGLTQLDAAAEAAGIIVADSADLDSLDAMVRQTRVVISTVGPFTLYGTPLVEACVKHHTHYVDISGEYIWMKEIIEKYQDEAVKNQVIIVPASGFDSVPSDLGVFMVADYIRERYQLNTAKVKASVLRLAGGISGGTVQSILGSLVARSLPKANDPYFIATTRGLDKPYVPGMHKDNDFDHRRWQAFFIMSAINTKIVRRSWSLWTERGQGYGRLFQYDETMSLPFVQAALLTMGLYTIVPLFVLALHIPGLGSLIKKLLPSPGDGPTTEQRKNGHFEISVIGTAETEPYEDPVRVRGTVKGFRDPGYGDTCRMVVESALCIVKSLDRLPGKEGGILTPSTAFGQILIDRLRTNGGMVFEAEPIK